MDKRASSSREPAPRSPAAAPAERPYAGGHLDDLSPAGTALQAFADLAQTGPRAVAQRRALGAMFGPVAPPAQAGPVAQLAPGGVVQAKLEFSGTRARLSEMLRIGDLHVLHGRVLAAIDASRPMLEEMKVEGLAETRDELERFKAFQNNLTSLVNSSVDYGEINLDNPQHVYLYVKDAARFLNRTRRDSVREEAAVTEAARLKEEKRLAKDGPAVARPRSPGTPDVTFQVALLGTGASVADYINVHGTAMDPTTTVVIGESQPWKPSKTDARSRGIGFVNHPANMTSPRRETTQLPAEPSGADEGFKGNAEQLSGDIDFVIDRFGARRVKAAIGKVKRLDSGWYQITTNLGEFYAWKVVSGLGIGPHRFAGQNKLEKQITTVEHKAREKERVLDLDAFQREAANPLSPLRLEHARNPLTIGVSGPNAGTDAVHVATELGMLVKWIVSADGPAIAEGMGNKISRVGLVTVYFDYLKGWTISAADYIRLDIGGKWPDTKNPGNTRDLSEGAFLEDQPGWSGRLSRDPWELVDYLVIAQGPEVATLWNVFDPSATKDLELKGDPSGRFGAATARRSQGTIETSLEHSSYNIRYVGIDRAVTRIFVKEKIEGGRLYIYAMVRDQLQQGAFDILGVTEFAPIILQSGVAPQLASTDGSFEIIGGSAIRVLNYLDMPANQDKAPRALRGGGKEDRMKQVLKTLPTPTLLNNDQLTPIRSQIEASGDYMPGYVGTKESNFVTDDQTMIAAQIAAEYVAIPGELANWVTQKIIQDRHVRGVRPGTSGGSRAFVDLWKGKLAKLDALFSSANLKRLALEAVAAK
ncbi:hypothetical protein [Phenylobacterium sp.]|uniref:hypothetical protein n=1 Tax=Phenylobacterium sp. TaxID=1871053 RepID=UPI0025D98A6D|nr:hypothetical protein [Phenylobacterium sp.]